MTQSQSSPAGAMRSIMERMTAPTEQDLAINARLGSLRRNEVTRIVDHMRQVMEHLAHQRDDLTVERITAEGVNGFTVRLDTNTPENPLIVGTAPPKTKMPKRKR